MKKNCKKTSQEKLSIEKVIKRKITIHLIVGLMKKNLYKHESILS